MKELLEYDDYVQKPTKANASSLITLALEEHWKQVQQTDGYMKYIATRPRAECSSEMQPLVFRTFWTLSVRRRRSSSPLN